MTRLLRRLTEAGCQDYRAWLVQGACGAPPHHLLTDPGKSEQVCPPTHVPDADVPTRYELGRRLVSSLSGLDTAEIRLDAGVWDWLALLWFDRLCPPAKDGSRTLREIVRYSLDLNYKKRYRHLVRESWNLVSRHGENARFMLSCDLPIHGDALEQICSRQDLIHSKAMIGVASMLWWDEAAAKPRPGYATSERSGKRRSPARGGNVGRLHQISRQLRLTYDLDSMDPGRILDLLPREFDRWRRSENDNRSKPPSDAPHWPAGARAGSGVNGARPD
jgi:hypothetical protein